MKIKSFLDNNSTLFFSWSCALFYFVVEYVILGGVPISYLKHIEFCYYLLIVFVLVSIFYSFYQSIKNINISKIWAFILLILYFIVWIFLVIDCFDDKYKDIVTKFIIFIFINICIYLTMVAKKNRVVISYLMFYGINSVFILIFLFVTFYDRLGL